MPEVGRPSSPLIRSLSPQDYVKKKQQNKKAGFKYGEEGGGYELEGGGSEATLLQDLDMLLHRKLQLNNLTFEGSPEAANNASAVEEDEEFTNVDEIDGPISPSACKAVELPGAAPVCLSPIGPKAMRSEPPEPEDANMPVDAEYKEQLDRRAEEISAGLTFHAMSKPTLDWSLRAFYGLGDELSEWFDLKDYLLLQQAESVFKKRFDPSLFAREAPYQTQCVAQLRHELASDSLAATTLQALCYIAFGTPSEATSVEAHLASIRCNCRLLALEMLSTILATFKRHAVLCRDEETNLAAYNALFLQSSTLLYVITCVCLDMRDSDEELVDKVVASVHEAELVEFITKYIERWRWHSRLCMRIRSMIMLLFKLLTLQFGDESHYRMTKAYINDLHGIKTYDSEPEKLTVSPLDYEAFRIDIKARFPVVEGLNSKIPKHFDNRNSLSQFLEIPRPKAHTALKMTLPEPQLHIATPAPSPPGSPVSPYTPKARKSFQTNLCYPSLYPSDDEGNTDDLDSRMQLLNEPDNDNIIPYNIQEAIDILSKNVEVKLSVKQMWHERSLFMMQERGWKEPEKPPVDPYDYYQVADSSPCIRTMRHVESYYRNCLPSLNSLVYVLLQTIESNLSNHEYFLKDFPKDMSAEVLTPQLEISRAKEILLRSSSGILFTLLRWFKLSHILKFEYLASLIYDSKFSDIFIPLFSKFTFNYTERIYKKTVAVNHSFLEECSKSNTSYQTSYGKLLVEDGGQEEQINIRMISSEVYMLEILSRVIGKKTYRLKELPLGIGTLFNKLYQIFNLDIYHPILRIVRELTPFKNKRWKSEHVELISGVYLYEKLSLADNWVTGKDISGEMHDAYGHEIALRAMLQFYNFTHYKQPMEQCGYTEKPNKSFFSKESEILTSNY
ncbi:AGR339Cp [Eremothecium gossypii ATCC 10895]|uniref:AGR339Cp n=1 Tax=Eremothecium gossypii (strain ATCC 10895 / CBS 109.51 / FGSC 9923 / NRRL Y-1056) TaxID=284811 RepID=Q74Z67_EREGS|nr:AGR339Cp [Eremothecium gossypii ATCC 10895]AAS54829.1 AGR339Cp [Eremothecium gossypii ATCC 10895]AEY99161.1 FAGR339Cp [Eremothecium gossypii FDAG1]